MKRNVTIIPTLFVFLVYTNSAQTQPKLLMNAAPGSGGFSATRLARLDSGMSDWVKNKWVNDSLALIARNGKIIFERAYGYNNTDTKEPLDKIYYPYYLTPIIGEIVHLKNSNQTSRQWWTDVN
jgi:hypothetical protein